MIQSEAALRWLNDFSAQGILMTDAQLTICGWNHWLESRTGLPAAQMIGRNLFEAYPDMAARGLDRYYQDALAGQVRVLSHRFHRFLLPICTQKEGTNLTQMQQSARIAPLMDGEKIIGTITVIDDVSERVAREQELERLLAREQAAREEAEAANRAKDEFLATVSHELRTPLNAIFGWIQIMQRGGLDEEFLARGLETVERNVKIQAKLIEDILDVSRIITGKLSIEVNPVDPVSVIEAAIDAVRPAADAKQIWLDARLDNSVGPVSGDANRLQQVVWNLLSNAIKFTLQGGHVSITLQRVEQSSGPKVEIKVIDSGKGINPNFLPFVFDRFRQADSSTTRRHGGLGLGLAIVRHLVEMHGGTVSAESEGDGHGATFTVCLPMLIARKPESLTSQPVVAALNEQSLAKAPDVSNSIDKTERLDGIRVMVVDDESDARDMLSVLLTECGAEVRLAESVKDAIEALDGWRPDVLVSDIGMPDEDGYALIDKLKSSNGGSQHIPALALTGYARPEDRSRLLRAGYQLHLAKPVEIAELASAIARLAKRADQQRELKETCNSTE